MPSPQPSPTRILSLAVLAISISAGSASAQPIIAQLSGLASPSQVFGFAANLFPNFTPVSTEFPGLTITHARYFTTGGANNLVGGFLTNDPAAGAPDTVSITFAQPITDVSFVYHQIGAGAPSTMRALLFGTVVDSFSGTWNQSQPNNYFGFTNIAFDEVQIDFVSDFNIDTVAIHPPLPLANCITSNGSGVNPMGFTCSTLPVLGTTWQGNVAFVPGTVLTGIMFAPGGVLATPVPLFGGELLVQATLAPICASRWIVCVQGPRYDKKLQSSSRVVQLVRSMVAYCSPCRSPNLQSCRQAPRW